MALNGELKLEKGQSFGGGLMFKAVHRRMSHGSGFGA